jgi:fatty-acyl-CoA synthase
LQELTVVSSIKIANNFPLIMKFILERSARLFSKQELVDRDFKYTYHDAYKRISCIANALENLKIEMGDRVATLASNTHRHFELYWAVPCAGAILHPVNVRLHPEQIAEIVNHAEDKVIFLDEDFIPLVEDLRRELKTVEAYVIMTDKVKLQQTELQPIYEYEAFLREASSKFEYPELDENTIATLCYTTGTTGEPKGAYFTHRMLYLHTLTTSLSEAFSISRYEVVIHVVPMFHAHSWGLPYSSTLVGAKQVFPGRFDGKALMELIQREKVTVVAAVPTVYSMMLEHPEADKYDLSRVRHAFSGGAPTSMGLIKAFREKFDVQLVSSYGLTETCPVLTKAHLKPHMKDWPVERRDEVYSKTGLPLPGLDLKVIDDHGKEVAHNGKTIGEVVVRGTYVAPAYYKDPEKTVESWDKEGYFHTGDAAVVDDEGYITIADRYKDIIRSGGETIPSLMIDKVIEQHPAVAQCATVAMPNKKWGERPLAYVALMPKYRGKVTQEQLHEFCEGKIPRWQIPDMILFLDNIPLTSTGKKNKKLLKAMKVWNQLKT